MVRTIRYVFLLWLQSHILLSDGRENSRYLQSGDWGTVRTARSNLDKLDRRKQLRKQIRQNTRSSQEKENLQEKEALSTSTELTSTTTVISTTTQRMEDNDILPMMNRKLDVGLHSEGRDQFERVPDIDEPSQHRRLDKADMPVVVQREVSKDGSGLKDKRTDWRKAARRDQRRKKGQGGGEQENFKSNIGLKKKYEDDQFDTKNVMKTKLSQYIPAFSNSKKEERKRRRKEIKKLRKPQRVSVKDQTEESLSWQVRPSSINERIELRKLKRNQEKERKRLEAQNKFPKFPKSVKDLRKQKRKHKRRLVKGGGTETGPQTTSLSPDLKRVAGDDDRAGGDRQDAGLGLLQITGTTEVDRLLGNLREGVILKLISPNN